MLALPCNFRRVLENTGPTRLRFLYFPPSQRESHSFFRIDEFPRPATATGTDPARVPAYSSAHKCTPVLQARLVQHAAQDSCEFGPAKDRKFENFVGSRLKETLLTGPLVFATCISCFKFSGEGRCGVLQNILSYTRDVHEVSVSKVY